MKEEAHRPANEVAQATSQPFRLLPEELRLLAEDAKGMGLEKVREIFVLRSEDLHELIKEIDSAEDTTCRPP